MPPATIYTDGITLLGDMLDLCSSFVNDARLSLLGQKQGSAQPNRPSTNHMKIWLFLPSLALAVSWTILVIMNQATAPRCGRRHHLLFPLGFSSDPPKKRFFLLRQNNIEIKMKNSNALRPKLGTNGEATSGKWKKISTKSCSLEVTSMSCTALMSQEQSTTESSARLPGSLQ